MYLFSKLTISGEPGFTLFFDEIYLFQYIYVSQDRRGHYKFFKHSHVCFTFIHFAFENIPHWGIFYFKKFIKQR